MVLPFINKSKSNNKGQVGIVLLLVLAFALIFYAASMNIGRISQTKTVTQVAAMAGASQLASQMASYGQKLFQEQLGGKKRVCALTGVFMAILVIVIVVIIIVITIATAGAGSAANASLANLGAAILGAAGTAAAGATATAAVGLSFAVGLAVSLTLAVGNLALQAAVIQPGLTTMWNKIIQDTMGIQDQFMEQGIQIGLQNAVTDNKLVPDMQDFDNDFAWGHDAGKDRFNDLIGRFGYYYSEKRLKDITTPSTAKLAKFMNEMRDFVYKTPKNPYRDPPVDRSPNWGLYDPPDCKNNPGHECCYDARTDPDGDGIPGKPIPSYCNPCCIPEKVANPLEDPNVTGDEFVPARPSCCDCIDKGCPASRQCGTAATCAALSPYGADYPYVFTRYYENVENNFPRKRIQVVPDEDPNIITIDGKIPMPTPVANKFWKVSFDGDTCPGTEPPTGPIRDEYWRFGSPIYSFGKSKCPRDFVVVREKVTPTPPDPFTEIYAGFPNPCNPLNQVKVSKVGYYEYEWGCDGIEPPPDSFISFREALGTDDENKLYRKDPEFDPIRGANGRQVSDPDDKFRLEDTTGYFSEPDYTGLPVADKKKGIFPFFYKLRDWGTDIATVDITKYPEHCYWYDKRTNPCVETGPIINQQPGGLRFQLELPLDPSDPTLVYNKTGYVDPINVGGVILKPDAIDVPSTNNSKHSSQGILGLEDECAQRISPLYPEPSLKGFWKPGGDRFCQPPENPPPDPDGQNWPYFGRCAKSGGVANKCKLPASFVDTDGDGDIDDDDKEEDVYQECYCGHPDWTTDGTQYPDDALDDLVYGISDFLDVTRILFRKWESNKTRLAVNLKFWYPDIAEWIEPKEGAGTCFICDPEVQGQLWDGRDSIRELISRFENWRDASYFDNDVWCMPSGDPKVMYDEIVTFGRGALQDVVNCLTHNLSNDTRFQACYDACDSAEKWTKLPKYDWSNPIAQPGPSAEGYRQVLSAQLCNPLPRSLVPEFNGWDWIDSNPFRLQELMDCDSKTCPERFRSCNEQRCNAENACEAIYTSNIAQCEYVCDNKCVTCYIGCLNNYTSPTPSYYSSCTPAIQNNNGVCSGAGSCAQRIDCCGGFSNPACVTQWGSCLNNCYSLYFDPTNPGSCVSQCDQVFEKAKCIAKAEADRVQCYVTAKSDPLYGWDACITNNTKCGQFSGKAYDCKTEIGIDIHPGWTGNELFDVYGNPAPYSCRWPTPPSGLPPGLHPPGWPPIPPPAAIPPNLGTGIPVKAFIDDREAQKGSCRNDPDLSLDDEMIDKVKKSVPEAKNQAAKFQVRRDFLASRLAEANEILAILREAEKEITEFLEGPAKEFIEYRKEFEDLESGLPYHAIYGWQGPPAESRQGVNKGVGYWHIVKVEGRTPFKCDNRCGYDAKNPEKIVKDPQWPRVKTYTKNWGIERCYELVNTDGMVKFRVTRFDEDRDPNPNPTKFPGGQKLWDYRYFNPLRGRGTVGNLEGTCFEASIQDPPGLPAKAKDIYKGAFLMNRPQNDPDCWEKANDLLSKGASTELCAQYYYHGGSNKGLSHNFIKCRKDW